MHEWPWRIVKVGGSLFGYDPLVEALRGWLAAQPPAHQVLVAGGGTLADTIREADQRFGLGDVRSHWLCIDLLDVSAQILASLFPEFPLERRLAGLQSSGSQPRTVVFSPTRFLRQEQRTRAVRRLPCDWTVTSDSIAARIADVLQASELVLLKSADPPSAAEPMGGYVDGHFPTAAEALPQVRMVNLVAWHREAIRGREPGGSES
jgi:aspartokinase-like uncharacterized kinase